MDTLTHALSGALLARATAPGDLEPAELKRRLAAGFLACAAPDLDFVYGFFGPVEYLLNHRGPTHSLILLPAWAWALAWLLAKLLRAPGGWRSLYAVCAMGIGLHIAGDLITSYGTMILAPFLEWRAAIGTTFIIDLWFTGILVAGLALSWLFRRTRIAAAASLVVLGGYVGFQYVQKEHALEVGEQYARAHGLRGARVDAQPRPLSPFNWTVFVSDAEAHHFAHINLARTQPRPYAPGDGFFAEIDAPYLPVSQALWNVRSRYGGGDEALAKEAWNSPALGFFRWFAELPAYDGKTQGSSCYWFTDLRFDTPGRGSIPFRFGACREAAGAPWRAYERSQGSARVLVR